MDWKEEFEYKFMVQGGYINHERYSDVVSFIENLLEQEKKRMNDEIGKLENDTETVYNAGKCDYDNHVNKESVLSIVNKKCKFY
jgi:hypothetical protein